MDTPVRSVRAESNQTSVPHGPVSLTGNPCYTATDDAVWALEGCFEPGGMLTSVKVRQFPVRVGRTDASDLPVRSPNVSKHHAELLRTDGGPLMLRDCGSTNGTYLNGVRVVEPQPIGDGDLVQFADMEFRVKREREESQEEMTCRGDSIVSGWVITKVNQLLQPGGLGIHFQPIFEYASGALFGMEALVRGRVDGMTSPLQIFEAAEKLGLEQRVSSVCREVAVSDAARSGRPFHLFLNTHPEEALDRTLIDSLIVLRDQVPSVTLVVEIHEKAVGDLVVMREFKQQLHAEGLLLAYDDFGAGQSRLLELAAVPPDFLKFDRSLLKSIHESGEAHLKMVTTLLDIAHECSARSLAEGLDIPEADAVCRELGFEFVQGFLHGRPEPIEHWNAVGHLPK